MNAVNFDALMQQALANGTEKRLLLHVCCAPCASHCLSELFGKIGVTTYFYNPNIDGREEYEKRREELRRMLIRTGWADTLECDFDREAFYAVARGYEDAPERGARCEWCFRLRLTRTAQAAKAAGYDLFATTLTLSPLKNAPLINAIGREVGEQVGIAYLPTDFKKRGGYQHSLELSREFELYRQNYCGCEFSKHRLQ